MLTWFWRLLANRVRPHLTGGNAALTGGSASASPILYDGKFYIYAVLFEGTEEDAAKEVWSKLANEKGTFELWQGNVRRSRVE